MNAEPRTAGGWTDAWRLAVGTLSIVPVPPPRTVTGPVPGRAMVVAPVAGALVGAAAATVATAALAIGLSPLLSAIAAVGTGALLTRGLHLDGLADTADGLSASYDRERALAVMRRGDIGPSGVVTVLLVLLVQVAALAQVMAALSGHGAVLAAGVPVLLVQTAARTALPAACRRGVPPARHDGLGAVVAGSVHLRTLLATTVTVVLTLTAVTGLIAWAAGAAPEPLPLYSCLLMVLVAVTTGVALAARATRRLGGITGDVLGAAVEIAAACCCVLMALLIA